MEGNNKKRMKGNNEERMEGNIERMNTWMNVEIEKIMKTGEKKGMKHMYPL